MEERILRLEVWFVFYVYKLSSYILCINLAESDGVNKCKF